jgi:hypothetical protein
MDSLWYVYGLILGMDELTLAVLVFILFAVPLSHLEDWLQRRDAKKMTDAEKADLQTW